MKKLLSLAILPFLLSTNLFAEQPQSFLPTVPINTSYEFDNSMEFVQAQKILVVYAMNQEGKDKLRKLQKSGFECVHKMRGIWRCRKFLKENIEIPDSVRARVLAKYQGKLSLQFAELRAEPTVWVKSPIYVEWNLEQEVIVNDQSYLSYHLFESSVSDLRKFKIGNVDTGDFWSFLFRDLNTIQYSVIMWDRDANTQYLIYLNLTNNSI